MADKRREFIYSKIFKLGIHKTPINIDNHPIEGSISLARIASELEEVLSWALFQDIKEIRVGEYQELEDRNISAFTFKDKIYISSKLPTEEHYKRVIIHELAHVVLKYYGKKIFEDGKLQDEFIAKRRQLFYLLKTNNKPTIGVEHFLDPSFSQFFDDFLFFVTGYDYLDALNRQHGIVPTVYSLTSLEEYFSDGFESFFFDELEMLKTSCNVLFNKVHSVLEAL